MRYLCLKLWTESSVRSEEDVNSHASISLTSVAGKIVEDLDRKMPPSKRQLNGEQEIPAARSGVLEYWGEDVVLQQ